MTSYGPPQPTNELPIRTPSSKAQARKKVLERVQRQRIQNARTLREKLLRNAAPDPEDW